MDHIIRKQIKWEIEPDKMDFSKLRWFPEYLLAKPFKIEYVTPQKILNKLYPDIFTNRDNEMNNLIDFVNLGEKVIPPAFVRIPKILIQRYEENNKTVEIYTKTGLQIHDGCHRISLAKGLGLTKIPILIFDYGEHCKFSINRWVAIEGVQYERHNNSAIIR